MKQAALDFNLSLKKTHKRKTHNRESLEQMEHVVPWAALVALIAPYYPEGRTGRPPFALETMLCTHFLQQWFGLSDPAMEEAFFNVPLYREVAQLAAHGRLPDESTILRFRHRLEKHELAEGILSSAKCFSNSSNAASSPTALGAGRTHWRERGRPWCGATGQCHPNPIRPFATQAITGALPEGGVDASIYAAFPASRKPHATPTRCQSRIWAAQIPGFMHVAFPSE